MHQIFVKDNSKTVAQYLDTITKGLTVAEFKRVSIG
jgi:elongation factor Ts